MKNDRHKINLQYYHSPCGELVLASVGEELCLCDWKDNPCAERNIRRLVSGLNAELKIEASPVSNETRRQLEEYFAGNRKAFSIPLHPVGTDFQLRVWNALLNIPYGATMSYSQIAAGIGRPDAVRAVSGAIGANGISILIPCHRVIGSNRSLTGYAGGLEAKRRLLEIEGKRLDFLTAHLKPLCSERKENELFI